MLDRITPPIASPLNSLVLPRYESAKLDNGLPVYFLPYGNAEVIEIKAVFQAGKSYQSKAGLASTTANMLSEGTANYSALALSQALDQQGAWMGPDIAHESITFSLTTLTKHISATLPLMAEVIFEPTFPQDRFDLLQARKAESLSVKELKTNFQAPRTFGHLLFGKDHPYGMHLGREELAEISLEDVKSYYSSFLANGPYALIFTGQFDEKAIISLLNEYFGKRDLVKEQGNSLAAGLQSQEVSGRHVTPIEGMQSTVRLGHAGCSRSHPDYYRIKLVDTIFGGYFGSRLMANIREDKGYTYGIYSNWVSLKHDGYFIIQGDVGNEYVEPTIKEVYFEMNRLIQDGVDQAELDLVKNYIIGKNISNRETPFQLGDIILYSVVNGISFDELDKQFEVIQSVQPKEISEIAGKYLKPEVLLEVVAGKGE